jgi:hypothetical protein
MHNLAYHAPSLRAYTALMCGARGLCCHCGRPLRLPIWIRNSRDDHWTKGYCSPACSAAGPQRGQGELPLAWFDCPCCGRTWHHGDTGCSCGASIKHTARATEYTAESRTGQAEVQTVEASLSRCGLPDYIIDTIQGVHHA